MDFFAIINQVSTMSAYVPPHKRNQTQKPPPAPSTNQRPERLLTLGDTSVTAPKSPSKTMASRLAALKATENHIEMWVEPKNPVDKKKEKAPIIVECSDEEDAYIPLAPTDDGWTVVEKKAKPKRDKVQEALDNGDAPLSDEDEEQSYWDDQPEEFETYWDRKP